MERKDICCNMECDARFDCQTFNAALDVIAGKIRDYNIIECKNFNHFIK